MVAVGRKDRIQKQKHFAHGESCGRSNGSDDNEWVGAGRKSKYPRDETPWETSGGFCGPEKKQ